jgi:hypothetical protein
LYLNSKEVFVVDRYAILVDAGYFYAAAAQAVSKETTPIPRHRVSINAPGAFVQGLISRGAQLIANTNGPPAYLLRVYWYDALRGAQPTLEQSTVAGLPGVKVRFGTINAQGKQKGVDSLIVTDLVELARNRAVCEAILVSGDEDLRIAMQIAQTFGIRVHVLAVGEPQKNVNPSLRMEADSVDMLDERWLAEHVVIIDESRTKSVISSVESGSRPGVSATRSGGGSSDILDNAALRVCDELLRDEGCVQDLYRHFAASTAVPSEYDRVLLVGVAGAVGRSLAPEEKRRVRGMFVTQVRRLAAKAASPAR